MPDRYRAELSDGALRIYDGPESEYMVDAFPATTDHEATEHLTREGYRRVGSWGRAGFAVADDALVCQLEHD